MIRGEPVHASQIILRLMKAAEALDHALKVIGDRDAAIGAWAYLDADRARAEAAAIDNRKPGPLTGIVLGVKDNFDTHDQPTAYGSEIYKGHRPRSDASAVALLRRSGALCLGKTVTTEFAYFHPGKTRNPFNESHTPGGSSMGSAAGVASGMIDLALGTQTAGSVIRPASFCGIYGFKPTFGSVSIAGVKLLAPSLDTVGWFARDPLLLDKARVGLTGRAPATPLQEPPTIGIYRSGYWSECTQDSQRALEEVRDLITAGRAKVFDVKPLDLADELSEEAPKVMAFEAARSMAWEYDNHSSQLSDQLCSILEWGSSIDPQLYDGILQRKSHLQDRVGELFGGADVLLTPAALGEAPAGLDSTGDPKMARLWTLLGLPALALPASRGGSGLPVGVQLLARPGDDASLLAVCAWIAGLKGTT